MVVMKPCSMPNASCSTFATGARQFVVHDALEITVWFSLSYASSFTPRASVTSAPLAGAEMITFLAPASRWAAALSRSVKRPVDSITTSAPTSPHGRLPGSRSEKTRSSLPSTTRPSSVASTVPGNGPRIESYLSRVASVLVSVMSFTPTQSMSAPWAWAALKTFLPMRPKPLIPAFKCGPFVAALRGRANLSKASGPTRRLIHVAVHHVDHVAVAIGVHLREVLGDHDRAVSPARAADPDRQMSLSLAPVRGQQVVEQRDQPVVEVVQAVRVLDVVAYRAVEPGEVAQLVLVVRIGEEAHVEEEVRVARGAVLEAVRHERHGQLAELAVVGQHLVRHHLAEPRGGEVGGVDRHVGALLQRLEQLALLLDRARHLPALGERVAAARLLVAVEQHVLAGLEEEQAARRAARPELLEHLSEALEVRAAAHVAHDGGALDLAALVGEQLGERGDHLGRQVVDAEVARVLEAGHRLRLAG